MPTLSAVEMWQAFDPLEERIDELEAEIETLNVEKPRGYQYDQALKGGERDAAVLEILNVARHGRTFM